MLRLLGVGFRVSVSQEVQPEGGRHESSASERSTVERFCASIPVPLETSPECTSTFSSENRMRR